MPRPELPTFESSVDITLPTSNPVPESSISMWRMPLSSPCGVWLKVKRNLSAFKLFQALNTLLVVLAKTFDIEFQRRIKFKDTVVKGVVKELAKQ